MARLRFGEQSIAVRLFVVSALWSFAILLVAGLLLTAYYRRTSEQAFDDRLGAFQRALVADIVTTGSDRIEPGGLGDPRFEVALSGWYWQVTRLDAEKPEIQASRSLFAASLPRLADEGVPAEEGGFRHASVNGPDDRPLRIVERVIDTEGNGIYLVQVAASLTDIEAQIRRFELALAVTFALLALALVGTTAFQVRFGLRPLRRLEEGIAAIRRGETDRVAGAFPRDIAPLAAELNLLISANREIVERARTQVGNLAHALKTPLSVIVNEATGNKGALADKVGEQVQIMRDQVAYYLDRARAATRAGAVGTATEVAPVIAALQRTFEKIYRERALTISGRGARGLALSWRAAGFRGDGRQSLRQCLQMGRLHRSICGSTAGTGTRRGASSCTSSSTMTGRASPRKSARRRRSAAVASTRQSPARARALDRERPRRRLWRHAQPGDEPARGLAGGAEPAGGVSEANVASAVRHIPPS